MTDHNHATGQIRGLLCRACNVMIGHAREDTNILRAAIDYLERYSEKPAEMAYPIFSFEQIAGMGPLIN